MGKVIKAVILNVQYKGQHTTHTFYVITLGDDHMLLGMPFLATTNPDIDWTNGEFIGQIHVGTTDAHEWKPEQGSKEEGLFVLRPWAYLVGMRPCCTYILPYMTRVN